MSEYETLRVDLNQDVLELTLDRPELLNPLDGQAADELIDAIGAARAGAARAVLLHGAGRAFCSGGNLKQMANSLDGNPADFFGDPLGKIHEAALALTRLPLPVVCAVHGFATGAGFNLALCCDFVLCSPETRFNQAFIKLGLVPDTGGSFFLPRLVGTRRALELFLLGEFIEAEQAAALGIVNRVVPGDALLATARELAQRLTRGPTRAYSEIKQLVLGSTAATLAAALEAEREAQLRVAATNDFKEGVRAFLEKREAEFRGR